MPPSIIAGEPFDAGAMQLAYDAAEIHLRGSTNILADVECRLAVVNAALAEIERRQLSAE